MVPTEGEEESEPDVSESESEEEIPTPPSKEVPPVDGDVGGDYPFNGSNNPTPAPPESEVLNSSYHPLPSLFPTPTPTDYCWSEFSYILPVESLVGELGLRFAIYVISFFVIGLFWISYHQIFNHTSDSHAIIVWLNLVFLFFITIILYAVGLVVD